jgi:uncharacterized protein (TIRG00374 family)
MLKSRAFRVAVSVIISLVFLSFAVAGVDWNEAWEAMARAQYLYCIPMTLGAAWQLYIRAQRWRILLRPVGTPEMKTLVAATNIGFMANMVLPLRVGEVIRPVLVSRQEKQPLGGILATIVLERVFDVFTILALFGMTTALLPVSETVTRTGYGLLAMATLIAGGAIFIRWQEATALSLLRWGLRPFPSNLSEPIEKFFGGFVQALHVLESPGEMVRIVAWSFFLWLVLSAVFGCAILAFHLPVPIILGSIAVTTIVAIAVSAPSAPGFIGTFQLGTWLGLQLFGVEQSDAIACSIVLHVTQFVGVVGAGLYSLARQGMSLRQVEEVAEVDGKAA